MRPPPRLGSALPSAVLVAALVGGCSAPSSPAPGEPAPSPSPAATSASGASPGSTPTPSSSGATPRPSSPVPSPSSAPSSSSIAPSPARPPTPGSPTDVVTGLTSPWGLVALDDGSLLVSERDTGLIRHVVDGRAREVITVADVSPANEGGLLGLAVTADQRTVFAYHTSGRDNRITRYGWDGTELSDPTVILSGIPYASNHDGGRMVVGPDGLLYVGTGDALRPAAAQDRTSLAGKILRVTTAGRPAPGNPYGTAVFSIGHRNVQGLAFDDRGRLWASEFGDKSADELNLIRAGADYGWPEVEGTGGDGDRVDPVRTWDTDDASPSGLAFARGSLWMAGLRGERLWEIPLGAGSSTGTPRDHLVEEYGRLRSVTVAVDGALLVSTSNTDGRGDPDDGDDRVLRVPLG